MAAGNECAWSIKAGNSARILVVDDDTAVAGLIAAILKASGYAVQVCTDPANVEAVADPAPPDLVITDLSMPNRTGMDILRLVRDRYSETGAIVLTGLPQIHTAVEAMRLGALDYVVKPVSASLLNGVVTEALQRHRCQRASHHDILSTIAAQRETIAELQTVLRRASESTLTALTTALDARERATAGHSARVSRYAADLARSAGMNESEIGTIRVGSLLHDIGKIGIPDNILLKPSRLSIEEWDIMRKHPVIGCRILEPFDEFRDASELVLLHHERWDGGGYPRGLVRTEIPPGARIFAIVDAFDAMTSDRPYRRRAPAEAALREIGNGAGTQFDPDLARLFISQQAACL